MSSSPNIIGAIDAGTNAVRVVISRVDAPGRITTLHKERWPVRLGHQVFSEGCFGPQTLAQAAEAFAHFSQLFERFGVERARAVATSATRESRNREELLERIREHAGIELEVISGIEEARLTRVAVQHAWQHRRPPELIVDLGGGSLEIIAIEQGRAARSVSLPVGTVRLMEVFELTGPIGDAQARDVQTYVDRLLDDHVEANSLSEDRVAVGCGGNVAALADIVGSPAAYGVPSLDLQALQDVLPSILRKDIHARMASYQVRRDRAEVVGIAGIVLATLGQRTGIRALAAPDVGVREGVLLELSAQVFTHEPDTAPPHPLGSARDAAWALAQRSQVDQAHALHVREIALSIFDQLRPQHQLGRQARFVLEMGAMLHDVGYSVSRHKHHKHGEYIVRNAQFPGLDERLRDMVACMVRHHRKSFPAARHATFSSLNGRDQRTIMKLAGILRIADGLDAHRAQSVHAVSVNVSSKTARFVLDESPPSELSRLGATQRGHLFEVAFDLQPLFEHVDAGGPALSPVAALIS